MTRWVFAFVKSNLDVFFPGNLLITVLITTIVNFTFVALVVICKAVQNCQDESDQGLINCQCCRPK
jgi:hypothetical protein